ncbi:MAG: primosomal protein N', partial [Myxococcales bacterium]
MDRDRTDSAEPAPRDAAGPSAPFYARIAVGRPVRGDFTYVVPPALQPGLLPGRRVVVPFGRARAVGFYLGEASSPPPEGKARDVLQLLDEGPVFDPELLALLEWTATYYRYPLGETLRAALPPGLTRPDAAPEAREAVRELI